MSMGTPKIIGIFLVCQVRWLPDVHEMPKLWNLPTYNHALIINVT